MTYEEMAKAFLEARDKGFAGDLQDPNDCNSKCGECPAAEACTILSEDKDPKTFTRNYRAHIIPLLWDIK